MVHRQLAHSPVAGLRVILRAAKHMPFVIVQFGALGTIIVTGPARFFAEQSVLRDALGGNDAVVQLPGALQLM